MTDKKTTIALSLFQQAELDKDIWLGVLESISEVMSFIMYEEGKIPDPVVEALIEQWCGVINANYENIYILTKAKISKYLSFYYVSPSGGENDEFKYIYFTGMAVAEKLKEYDMYDLMRYHYRTVLHLLDERLRIPYGIDRPQLSARIEKAIEGDKLKEHFGEYGWYLTYKCLFNSARDLLEKDK